MTPGLRAIKALKVAGFTVRRECSPIPGIVEAAEIIERESGLIQLVQATEKLLAVCRHDDVYIHVRGHVQLVERVIEELRGT